MKKPSLRSVRIHYRQDRIPKSQISAIQPKSKLSADIKEGEEGFSPLACGQKVMGNDFKIQAFSKRNREFTLYPAKPLWSIVILWPSLGADFPVIFRKQKDFLPQLGKGKKHHEDPETFPGLCAFHGLSDRLRPFRNVSGQ
jgi:hypothetical protein